MAALKATKAPPHPWTFRSRAQRIAEWRLIAKQNGMDKQQVKAGVDMITRLYADLMRCEKRRVTHEAAVNKLIADATGYSSKYRERYDPGYTSSKDREKLGPRLGGKE